MHLNIGPATRTSRPGRTDASPHAILFAATLLALVLAFVSPSRTHAANHPELDWLTVETEHFIVHYHTGAEETAEMAAEIAETIYPRITGFYDWEPKNKTHFVVGDYEDYANGAAYFFDGKQVIWATNLEFDLRGTTQWLWNVITHEFTHLINIQASQRTPRNVPAIYFQAFDYESERRIDVLQGYPYLIVSYPWSGVMVPAWFAEGSAQWMAPDTHHDYWDAHRDMILRMAALDGSMLTYNQMSLFKGTLKSEQVYDHGYGLTRYIVDNHGPEALPQIIEEMGKKPYRVSVEGLLKKVTGKSGSQLYDGWRAEREGMARWQRDQLGDRRREGRSLGTDGSYNIRPTWSPDGKTLAWLSNMGSDFHSTALVMRSVDPADSTDAEVEVLEGGVTRGFCWSPDGESIYYARRAKKDRFGSIYYDVFRYDLATEESTRLTRGARLRDPAISPDGTRLVAVRNQNGTSDLVLIDLPAEEESANVTVLTASPWGRQYYSPRWHPDGEHVLVDMFDGGGDIRQKETRDLVEVDAVVGAEPRVVLANATDERLPAFMPGDPDRILFSCDASAEGFRKFDVLSLDRSSGEIRTVTNVLGGAFYPAVSPDGRTLAYARYTSSGYDIALLPMDEADGTMVTEFPALEREPTTVTRVDLEWKDAQPYQGAFARTLISPRVLVDEGRLRLGLYGSTGDVLDKQDFFGGISAGERGDGDVFAIYENRFWWPTIFMEAFWLRKHRDQTTYAKLGPPGAVKERRWDIETRYDTIEFDAGIKLQEGSIYSPFYYREIQARFRYSKSHINLKTTFIEDASDFIDDDGILLLPKDGWDYYRGRDLILSYYRRTSARRLDTQINPIGNQFYFSYMYSDNDLSPSGQLEETGDGVVRTLYDDQTFHQLEGEITHRRPVPLLGNVIEGRLSGGWISDRVDDFFWFRLGSQPGMRGYTYFSLEAQSYVMGRFTYRFPILKQIDRRLFQFLFERLYGGVFWEGASYYGGVFDVDTADADLQQEWVHDVGFELRLDTVNFYTFPAKFQFEAAYPLDQVPLPAAITDDTVAPGQENVLTTQDWHFYFRLLFDY